MVQDYYEGFSSVFGSYVYVRDNLLFQTGVSMPKELAEQYHETFESIQLSQPTAKANAGIKWAADTRCI